ncbi:MAG: toll/interleukin-1 receptor domain-containing protein [Clostridiales bacterium]|nr:toll/interleukin-1 receptor domain-containing protein [Clostridiales bacterium]
MTEEIRYDAFISYKHCDPDQKIAERLQKKLESYRLPKEVQKKTGKSRLQRVFRDESELAVAENLSEEIERAIRQSEYLICICSPQYLTSPWCMQELETFLKIRGKKNVLLVLAGGEPESAFPDVMMYEEVQREYMAGTNATVKVKVEPLAADCRANGDKERNNLVDKAVLRIVAAIFGIGYDDLVQRQRKEESTKKRNRTLIVFGILLTVLMISVFFLVKIAKQGQELLKQNEEILKQNEEIDSQNEIISQKYADSLAATSDNLLRDKQRKAAVYAARQALPDNKSDNLSENALLALIKALGIYDFPGYDCDEDILLPFSASYDLQISPYSGYASLKGLDMRYYILDLKTGETVLSFEPEEYSTVRFDGDNGCLFQRKDENWKYFNLSSRDEKDMQFDFVNELVSDQLGDGGYAFVQEDSVYFFRGTDQVCSFDGASMISASGNRHQIHVEYSCDSSNAIILWTDFDQDVTYIFSVALSGRICERVVDIPCALNYGNDVATDGETIVWMEKVDKYSYYLCAMDITSGVVSKKTDIPFVTYDKLAISGDTIIVVQGSSINIYNKSLEWKEYTSVSEYVIRVNVIKNGIAIVDYAGTVKVITDEDISVVTPVDTSYEALSEKVFRNDTLYCIVTGENKISTYRFRNSEYLVAFEGEETPFEERNNSFADDPETDAFLESVLKKERSYDRSRIYQVVLCQNADLGAVQLWDGQVCIYDGESFERIKTIYSTSGYVHYFYYDKNAGQYYLSADEVRIFDEDLRCIGVISDASLSGVDPDTGSPVIVESGKYETYKYLLRPITYEELIEMTDAYLGDYEPDERVREKYSLG